MTIRSDYSLLNDAGTEGDWATGGANAPDSPLLNNSSSTVPYYIQGTTCMEFALKSNSDGYAYDEVANLDFTNRLTVWWHWFPGPDVAGLPLNTMRLRFSDAAGFTTDYDEWDVVPFLEAAPGSFVAMKVWPTNPTASNGTPANDTVSSYGMVVATGGTDNKAAAFDHIFQIAELGGHSATYTETLFDLMYTGEAESNVEKVIGIWERAGDFFQSNVRIALGNDVAANTIVTESNKTVFFDNVEPEQELGYIFYGGSTGEIDLTLNSVVHFWNSQESTHEIFQQITEVDDFIIDGCSFTNGGQFTTPADAVNRYVRATKFDNCQAGTISDGEFTNNIVSNGEAVTVSGDADLTGTQVLTPVVAADASALVWTGNLDPDGNLDNMTFSKGTLAHHAIEFGTSTPLTMTLRGIDFTDFGAVTANDAALYVRRTSGTVTINLVDCTGTINYKSSGAIVDLVVSPVTLTVNVTDEDGNNLQNARVFVETAATIASGEIYQAAVTSLTQISGVATLTTTAAHGLATGDYVVIRGAQPDEYNKVAQVTVTSTTVFTYSVGSGISSPATGTPVVSWVAISALTNASGNAAVTRSFAAAQQMKGWARLKNSVSPFYQDGNISFTINTTAGNTINTVLLPDE